MTTTEQVETTSPLKRRRMKRTKTNTKTKPPIIPQARARGHNQPKPTPQPPKLLADIHIIQKRVVGLYLNGMEATEIVKSTGYAVSTIRDIVKAVKGMVANIDSDMYLETYIKTYNGILSSYKTINQELFSQYVALQQSRDTHELSIKASDNGSTDQLTKDRDKANTAMNRIADRINANNKNYVEMIGRMGVPHSAPSTDIGSHTDSPLETFYEDMSLDADGEAQASLKRQLEFYEGKDE